MKAIITHKKESYSIDLYKPLDISIPLRGDTTNVNAWYTEPPKITPHTEGEFVGKVTEGASTNFNDIWFNPHAHGTHTECVGHITEEFHSVNKNLKKYFFLASVITIAPEKKHEDFVISKKQLQYALKNFVGDALVIRTLPNLKDKMSRKYSNSNPPYLLEDAVNYLVELGVEHLLVDLPSIDKEKDDGELLGHNAFWNTTGTLRKQATITEFVFVGNAIKDGLYFLNLQVAPFENDASPSRPVLYKIKE
ncbi:cyclase family protein [Cellulophaga sp. E16_2]|uniref:cyclase family protein n=1 Tax=Cellulophaga sp. E16_2 TaxID=2789297 RepID=UPI001A938860|nr:cyclase family protein [Cellulophaga sp. E16_2]MBO0591741.1 cyclase family protein [Cellulophaga sp. E16_2]